MTAIKIDVGGVDGADFVTVGTATKGFRLWVRQFGSHVDIELTPALAGEVLEAMVRLGVPLNNRAAAALERSAG